MSSFQKSMIAWCAASRGAVEPARRFSSPSRRSVPAPVRMAALPPPTRFRASGSGSPSAPGSRPTSLDLHAADQLLQIGGEIRQVQRTNQPGVGARRCVESSLPASQFSPLRARCRILSALARASSSSPTFAATPSPGTLTKISRRVMAWGVVNSFRCAS